MRSRRTAASPILSRPTARAPIATAPIAAAPAAAAMTATNPTEAAPVERAPVACTPVARARGDMVCGCCIRMISLLDRIWDEMFTTFRSDGPSLAAVNFHEAMAMAEHFGVGQGRHPEDFWAAESAPWRL